MEKLWEILETLEVGELGNIEWTLEVEKQNMGGERVNNSQNNKLGSSDIGMLMKYLAAISKKNSAD